VDRGRAALAWVVRNLRHVDPAGPAVPAGFVVMRAIATPLERTNVLHALLRQLGLDAALIGDGGGPETVWAVGLLADGQIHLFDARLGLPPPGPGGAGVLTLTQARTAADPFQPLAVDPKLPYDVTADRAKRAEVLVTAPLAALSPRMRFLQGLLSEGTARLTADPAGERDRFLKAVSGPAAPPVRLWCPPVADALPRLLFAFLPTTEGGGDPAPPGRRRLERYYAEQVAYDLLPPFLRELQGEPGNRVRVEFVGRITMLSQPGRARDLILRGRFREATDQLVAVLERVKRRPGGPRELEQATREWAAAARGYYAELSRRERGRGDPASAVGLEEQRSRMDNLWRAPRGPQTYLDYVVSDALAAEVTYLLGLCKHEEAERLLCHPETAGTAKPAWNAARQWWTSFLTGYPNSPWAPAAKRNLARCLEAGGQKDQARGLYESLAESLPNPLERLACRYLAVKLK
jgi:hypothetical protein